MLRSAVVCLAVSFTCLTCAPAVAARMYAVTSSNDLISFDSSAPSTLLSNVAVSGIGSAEAVVGCDFRPSSGQLYIVTIASPDVGRLYTVDRSTGIASLVALISAPLSGSFYGMDFDPIVDRIRLVNDAFQNLQINPDSGNAVVETSLSYASGDPAGSAFPAVFSCAYSNSFPGASSTTLYGIDVGQDTLVIQNPPDAGLLNTVGSLGVDAAGLSGFDVIGSSANEALAALGVGGAMRLFGINLATGQAADLGQIGSGDSLVGLAAAPVPQTAFAAQQKTTISSSGEGYQELIFNYSTSFLVITGYNDTTTAVSYELQLNQWLGIFHYDYTAGAYTQAAYRLKLPL